MAEADAFIEAVRKRLHPEEPETSARPITSDVNPADDVQPGASSSAAGAVPPSHAFGTGRAKETTDSRKRRTKSLASDQRASSVRCETSGNSVAMSSADNSFVADGPNLTKRRKTKPQSDSERRGARYRPHPSKSVLERYTRSLRHRLFLIDRSSSEDPSNPDATSAAIEGDENRPVDAETFAVMGVNGNVYRCVISTTPSCDCPDFTKRGGSSGHGPCKHLIFVFIRVLKLKEEDPIWWQTRLLPEEVSGALKSGPRAASNDLLADDAVRRQYRTASASHRAGESTSNANRKPIEGDCPICYEHLGEADVLRPDDVTTFCETCGNNFHKTCVQNWTRARGQSSCPLCRSNMSRHEASLARDQPDYTNLAAYSSQHARQLTLAELYADTHHYIGRASRGRGRGRGNGRV